MYFHTHGSLSRMIKCIQSFNTDIHFSLLIFYFYIYFLSLSFPLSSFLVYTSWNIQTIIFNIAYEGKKMWRYSKLFCKILIYRIFFVLLRYPDSIFRIYFTTFLNVNKFFFKWYKYYDEDTLAILCFIGRVLYCLLRASVVFDDEFSRQ